MRCWSVRDQAIAASRDSEVSQSPRSSMTSSGASSTRVSFQTPTAINERHERGEEEQPHLRQRGATLEQGRAERASRVDRGAGQRDADQVHSGQREADGQAGEGGGGDLLRHQQDDQDERGGQQRLEDEGAGHVDGAVVEGVGAQGAGLVRHAEGRHEQLEHGTAGDRAGELGGGVAGTLAAGHALGQDHGERDGGVDVGAGDRAECVGQHQDDKAERERDADDPRARAGLVEADATGDAEDSRADGEEDQEEGADELSTELATHNRWNLSHDKGMGSSEGEPTRIQSR